MSNAEFTRNDLRNAVVSTLEERPNHSCKKDILPNLVCSQLKIQIFGNARKKLKQEIRVVISALKRANIIEEYKAKNKRYRLETNYKDSLSRLLNRGSGDEICFDGRVATDKSDTDVDPPKIGDMDLSIGSTTLPPLPDTIESPLFEQEEPEEDEYFGQGPVTKTETSDLDLLNVMSGPDHPISNENETDSNSSYINTSDTNDIIVSLIESFVANQPNLSCEVRFNQIRLTLTIDEMRTLILISFTRSTGLVAFRALFPELSLTPENILIESANDLFSCIPSLKRGTGGIKFQLRRTIPITSEPERCIPDTLDEVINDTVRIIELAKDETV